MKSLLLLAALCGLGGLAVGCRVHVHERGGVVTGVVVEVPHGHVHSAHCGHYYHHGRWYYWQGHVHGHG